MKLTILKNWMVTLLTILFYFNIGIQGTEDKNDNIRTLFLKRLGYVDKKPRFITPEENEIFISEGNAEVCVVAATDFNGNQINTFWLSESRRKKNDHNLFMITEAGVLKFKNPIDFESQSMYSVTIVAADKDWENFATKDLRITKVNVDKKLTFIVPEEDDSSFVRALSESFDTTTYEHVLVVKNRKLPCRKNVLSRYMQIILKITQYFFWDLTKPWNQTPQKSPPKRSHTIYCNEKYKHFLRNLKKYTSDMYVFYLFPSINFCFILCLIFWVFGQKNQSDFKDYPDITNFFIENFIENCLLLDYTVLKTICGGIISYLIYLSFRTWMITRISVDISFENLIALFESKFILNCPLRQTLWIKAFKIFLKFTFSLEMKTESKIAWNNDTFCELNSYGGWENILPLFCHKILRNMIFIVIGIFFLEGISGCFGDMLPETTTFLPESVEGCIPVFMLVEKIGYNWLSDYAVFDFFPQYLTKPTNLNRFFLMVVLFFFNSLCFSIFFCLATLGLTNFMPVFRFF